MINISRIVRLVNGKKEKSNIKPLLFGMILLFVLQMIDGLSTGAVGSLIGACVIGLPNMSAVKKGYSQ